MSDASSGGTAAIRGVVPVVMFCHFIAAFVALGMPPFFALILQKSLHSEAGYLAGWFYVVPTLFAALSAPWWGRLADRFGKKSLLIRAQIGLAASFLLAGYAADASTFFAALVLQGVLGGTFAASNAYVATLASGATLTRSLTAMQWSARAALVVAPACLGLWIDVASPIVLYRYLALLPLSAALLIALLPAGGHAIGAHRDALPVGEPEATARQIYMLQFAFAFATVVTFPYFVSHAQQSFGTLSTGSAALLFGLPHLVYLVAAMPLARRGGNKRRLRTLGLAYAALAASIGGQMQPPSLEWLVLCRLAMGAAMTVGFIALHGLVASVAKSGTAGRTFGWFESSAKWGGVAAGLCAGLVAGIAGTGAPFVAGAVAALMAAMHTAIVANVRTRIGNTY